MVATGMFSRYATSADHVTQFGRRIIAQRLFMYRAFLAKVEQVQPTMNSVIFLKLGTVEMKRKPGITFRNEKRTKFRFPNECNVLSS
jgi:hypothetical protein